MTNTQLNKLAAVITSDQHGNHKRALCPPVVGLDEGGTYHASRLQRQLWEAWIDFWDWAGKVTADYPRTVGFFNGDLGELDAKRRTYSLVTPNKATILDLLLDMLEPALANLDAAYFIRGTAAHTGKSSWLEEAIAKDVDIAVPSEEFYTHQGKKKKIYSHYHFRGMAAGVPIDVAHHASVSGIPYRRNSSADTLAFNTWVQYIRRKIRPPRLVLRGHIHQKILGDWEETQVLFTPGWAGKTDYDYRQGRENEKPEVGGLVIFCENGEYSYQYKTYEIKEFKRLWAIA